jgi:hypothetical protein
VGEVLREGGGDGETEAHGGGEGGSEHAGSVTGSGLGVRGASCRVWR